MCALTHREFHNLSGPLATFFIFNMLHMHTLSTSSMQESSQADNGPVKISKVHKQPEF